MKRMIAIFKARNLEFFRDRSTFIWNLVFPLFLVFGFSFFFSGDGGAEFTIGVIGENQGNILEFASYEYLEFVTYSDFGEAENKLKHHQLDMIIDYENSSYYINKEATNGYLLEKILESDDNHGLSKETVTGEAIRYIDWFVPGVLGMNIMMGCLMGVGFVIVRYRKNGVLKRFKATPLHSIEFIGAQLLSRFFIVVLMSVVVFVISHIFLRYRVQGSYFSMLIITCLAIFTMLSLGLVFASRLKSEELAGGLINIIMWPMMFLSGIWFSLEGAPDAVHIISFGSPITHFLEAFRGIMLDGETLTEVMDHILVLTGMSAVFLGVASFLFKWE